MQQRLHRAELSVGLTSRNRTDREAGSGLSGSSSQVETRLTAPITKDVSLLAQNDTTLSPSTDPVYTDRTSLGADWKAKPGVDVRLTEQVYGRGQYKGHAVTSLETVAEHKGGDGTQLSERFALTGGAGGFALEQSLGLGKRWIIIPAWASAWAMSTSAARFSGAPGQGINSHSPTPSARAPRGWGSAAAAA